MIDPEWQYLHSMKSFQENGNGSEIGKSNSIIPYQKTMSICEVRNPRFKNKRGENPANSLIEDNVSNTKGFKSEIQVLKSQFIKEKEPQ